MLSCVLDISGGGIGYCGGTGWTCGEGSTLGLLSTWIELGAALCYYYSNLPNCIEGNVTGRTVAAAGFCTVLGNPPGENPGKGAALDSGAGCKPTPRPTGGVLLPILLPSASSPGTKWVGSPVLGVALLGCNPGQPRAARPSQERSVLPTNLSQLVDEALAALLVLFELGYLALGGAILQALRRSKSRNVLAGKRYLSIGWGSHLGVG